MAATHLLTLSLLFLHLAAAAAAAAAADADTASSDVVVHLVTTPVSFVTPTSFSAHFSYSLSPHSSLSLLLLPSKTLDSIVIKFGSNSVKIGNVSCPNFVPIGNRQRRLHGFVDYWAGSGQLEVRLGIEGRPKPYRPLIILPVDLSQLWKGEEVLIGLGSSSNGDLGQGSSSIVHSMTKGMHSMPVDPRGGYGDDKERRIRSVNVLSKGEEVLVGAETRWNGESGGQDSNVVYSWRFRAWRVPKGMHSVPGEPRLYERRSAPCYLTVVLAIVITVGCCVFVVFMVMFFKVILTDWDEVMEREYTFKPVKGGYEMVGAEVENNQYGNVKC